MARDEQAPVDPEVTQDREIDPTQTIPQRGQPQGDGSDLDGGDYQYWLRDGVTPYRTLDNADAHVFSRADDSWMYQHTVDHDGLWPSSPEEIAGMIGGRQRLTEPVQGAMPLDPGPDEDFAPVPSPDDLAEADSAADAPLDADASDADTPQPPPSQQGTAPTDLPPGGMNEQQIRNAGLRIDVPYDDPLPVALKYKDTGQQAWTPPAGFRQGMPPIDDKLASDLGVSRDLGQDQEGAEGGSTSGDPGDAG